MKTKIKIIAVTAVLDGSRITPVYLQKDGKKAKFVTAVKGPGIHVQDQVNSMICESLRHCGEEPVVQSCHVQDVILRNDSVEVYAIVMLVTCPEALTRIQSGAAMAKHAKIGTRILLEAYEKIARVNEEALTMTEV